MRPAGDRAFALRQGLEAVRKVVVRRDHARPLRRRRRVRRIWLAVSVSVLAIALGVASGLLRVPATDPSGAIGALAGEVAAAPIASPEPGSRESVAPGAAAGSITGAALWSGEPETAGPSSGGTEPRGASVTSASDARAARASAARRFGEAVPPRPAALTGYRWPLPHGRVTLPFGPTPWGSRVVDGELFHDGVDIATFCGDRVVAAHDGVVLAAGRHYDQVMGWVGDLAPYLRRLDQKDLWSTLPIVIVIDDGDGYRSIYAHFWKVVVHKGQQVKAGQLIGYEGMTGRATGCHVHFGLFYPQETATFGITPDVVSKMKTPALEIATIDPLLVLPPRGRESNGAGGGSGGGHELPPVGDVMAASPARSIRR